MNKLLIALGLAAAVVLVGCSKEKAPETGATTGEHLENAAEQAGHDINKAASEAVSDTQKAADEASAKIGAAVTKLLRKQKLLLKMLKMPLKKQQLMLLVQ